MNKASSSKSASRAELPYAKFPTAPGVSLWQLAEGTSYWRQNPDAEVEDVIFPRPIIRTGLGLVDSRVTGATTTTSSSISSLKSILSFFKKLVNARLIETRLYARRSRFGKVKPTRSYGSPFRYSSFWTSARPMRSQRPWMF